MRFFNFANNLRVVAWFVLIGISCLEADHYEGNYVDEKQKILEKNNLAVLDISVHSRELFQKFLDYHCLGHINEWEVFANYIQYERVEFMKEVKELVNNEHSTTFYDFHNEYHEIISNCTLKNDTRIESQMNKLDASVRFENNMIDIMFGVVPTVLL